MYSQVVWHRDCKVNGAPATCTVLNLYNSAWRPRGGGENPTVLAPSAAMSGGSSTSTSGWRNGLFPPRGCHVVVVSSVPSGDGGSVATDGRPTPGGQLFCC